MIAEVLDERTRSACEEARQCRVDALGLPEAKPDVKHGLHGHLHPRHTTRMEVAHVSDNRGRLVTNRALENAG